MSPYNFNGSNANEFNVNSSGNLNNNNNVNNDNGARVNFLIASIKIIYNVTSAMKLYF